MEKILVLRGGALGDFIVTLPLLAALRGRWPDARIELAGNATAAQLALNRGLLDAVHSQHEARWAALYDDAPLPKALDAWLAGFDLVINFWPDTDGEIRRRFPRHVRQCFLSGAAMPERSPAAAHYCEPLGILGIEPPQYFQPLTPLATDLNTPPELQPMAAKSVSDRVKLANCVFIHPGSGSPRKNWPRENWLRLMQEISQPVVLVLGEAELASWEKSVPERRPSAAIGAQVLPAARLVDAPLETLVNCFAGCRLFVGHDSGISHLAAASGAQCVLLFGPTEPACWAPPAPSVQVIRSGPDLASLSVSVVRTAVAAALAGRR